MAAVLGLGAAACAPRQGWELTPQRTCERGGPALVCAEVDPDRPLRFELGGTALVPGECVASPEGGGLLRVAVDDGRHHTTDYRWIRAPRGRVTRIGVRDGKLWLKVEGRERCGAMPVID